MKDPVSFYSKPTIKVDTEAVSVSSVGTLDQLPPLKVPKLDLFGNNDDLSDEEKLKLLLNEYPGFVVGKIIGTGAAFGEIALQNRVRR